MGRNLMHDTSASHVHRQKRGITREEAADFCGIAPSTFDAWVRAGKMPGPVPGTKRWDLKAIEKAWDKLSGLTDQASSEDDEFAQWVRQNGLNG